ncbi:uncharacterized protein [Clytia hemisphaerica]|uniref:Cnidarian restricted protein n=1 Tax=Clytia hemisphaerica TaxID=252671 RepID=A0A7M5VD61_9CNID
MSNMHLLSSLVAILTSISLTSGVEIKTVSPEVYQVGKSAILVWNITYTKAEVYKHSFLNLSFNDTHCVHVGPNNKKAIELLWEQGISVLFDTNSVVVRVHKLNYGDVLNCSVEAFGQTASFKNISLTRKTILLQNVKGGVTNCGSRVVQKVYQIQEDRFSTHISLTLCGNPTPSLKYTWAEESNGLARINHDFEDAKTRKYRYSIDLYNITRKHCGSEIHFKAFGFKRWMASSRLMVKYKASKVKKNFTIVKLSTFSGTCCTIFKLPAPETQCKQTFNIFAYDVNKTLIMTKLYHEENQLTNCNDKALFRRIKFARIQAVTWDGQLGEMSQFFQTTDERQVAEVPKHEETKATKIKKPLFSHTVIIILVVMGALLVVITLTAILVSKNCHGKKNARENEGNQRTATMSYTELNTDAFTSGEELAYQGLIQSEHSYEYPDLDKNPILKKPADYEIMNSARRRSSGKSKYKVPRFHDRVYSKPELPKQKAMMDEIQMKGRLIRRVKTKCMNLQIMEVAPLLTKQQIALN